MDYLDPKKKREHKIRLLLGYGLFAIAIGISTLLLVYMANGYDVDRNTGQVIQNGLIYVDSRPGGADVVINGEKQRGTTDVRLVVPAGPYSIDLDKEGYRKWNRSLLLEGGSLRRLTYARLVPDELTTTSGSILRDNPVKVSQSIDKKWLVMSYIDKPLQLQLLNTDQTTPVVVDLEIPSTAVTNTASGIVEIVEWADDNRNMLVSYTVGASVEYLLVDRENPASAQNLSALFADSELKFELRDRKRDSFFAYKPSVQSLYTATATDGLSASPLVTKVQTYKTFGEDWVLYITDSGKEGLVDARFKRADKDILIKQIKTSDKYLLQLAKLQNAPIMGISSTVEDRAIIYNDPEKYLNENPDVSIPIATTVLRVKDPLDLRISADSSVILAYGSENFASHEFEADRSYTYKVTVPVDSNQKLRWLDGQHFLFSSNNLQMMMDFDGSNMYELVSSVQDLGSFFSTDLDLLYTFAPAVSATGTSPAVPANISITNLLTEADR